MNCSNITADGICINLQVTTSVAFQEITKWIALVEALGIIILNSILIVMLAKPKNRSRMTFFVCHLAFADLCVGLFYVLPECVFDRFMNKWDEFPCLVLYGYCANLTIYASTFVIVVLSIDRLFVIIRPLAASTKGRKYRYGLVSTAWILAMSLAVPYALHIKYVPTPDGNFCGHDFPNQEAMVVAELCMNLIIPVSVITFCYSLIIIVIWTREKTRFEWSTHRVIFRNGRMRFTQQLQDTSTSPVITKARKRSIKVLFIVVIVYIVSWMPINVAQVLNVFNLLHTGDVYVFLHVLSPVNSLMNPVVFLLCNRQIFKSINNQNIGYMLTSQTDIDRVRL